MPSIIIPAGLDAVIHRAWTAARDLPGFLTENEGRFLAMAAACAPPGGTIVEIGSFKGKSTVVLATVAKAYGLQPVTAIDPHTFHSAELEVLKSAGRDSTYEEFLSNLATAGVSDHVDVRRSVSADVAQAWHQPLRFLWIDGDHSYPGAKADFDNFLPHLVPGAIVAFHDALHEFPGPIRVFVEEVLRSDRFGAAGFVGSIAWAQFLPNSGAAFRDSRDALDRLAAPLIPHLADGNPPHGLSKFLFKLRRSRVPRKLIPPEEWVAHLNC